MAIERRKSATDPSAKKIHTTPIFEEEFSKRPVRPFIKVLAFQNTFHETKTTPCPYAG